MSIHKSLRSITFAWQGICLAWKREHNLRLHFLVVILLVISTIAAHLDRLEIIAITLAATLVLTLEMTNTAIEKLADHLHPQKHSEIAFVKDVLAGAVLISAIGATIVAVAIFGPHLVQR